MNQQNIQRKRLLSLDAFRGLTIAGMILVNTPGSWSYVYPPLLHAKWHGCTPTDLVFPFFLFIVGVSMSFSYGKFSYQWSTESALKLMKRTLLIFTIGLLLNAFPFYGIDWSHFRIMGVLQRISLAFGIGGLAVLLTKGKNNYLFIIAGILLLFYWFMLWYFGGEKPFSLEGNMVKQVDALILGENHLYRGFGIAFDPEGLLSSMPAVVTVIIGFLIGKQLQGKNPIRKRISIMFFAGIALIALGLLWDLVFPMNKPLWTSSYVLFTAGLATQLLLLFYILIDHYAWKKWSMFFVVFGVNPLFGFVLSVIWVKILIKILRFTDSSGIVSNGYGWLYNEIFVPVAGNMNGSLLFAIWHIILFWAILYRLYKRKIFIKI